MNRVSLNELIPEKLKKPPIKPIVLFLLLSLFSNETFAQAVKWNIFSSHNQQSVSWIGWRKDPIFWWWIFTNHNRFSADTRLLFAADVENKKIEFQQRETNAWFKILDAEEVQIKTNKTHDWETTRDTLNHSARSLKLWTTFSKGRQNPWVLPKIMNFASVQMVTSLSWNLHKDYSSELNSALYYMKQLESNDTPKNQQYTIWYFVPVNYTWKKTMEKSTMYFSSWIALVMLTDGVTPDITKILASDNTIWISFKALERTIQLNWRSTLRNALDDNNWLQHNWTLSATIPIHKQ